MEAFLGASASKSKDYPRRRDEAWFEFAEKLPGLDLPADEELAADLLAPRYRSTAAGRACRGEGRNQTPAQAQPRPRRRRRDGVRYWPKTSAGQMVVGVVAAARGAVQPVHGRPFRVSNRQAPLSLYVDPPRPNSVPAGSCCWPPQVEIAQAIVRGRIRFDAGQAVIPW